MQRSHLLHYCHMHQSSANASIRPDAQIIVGTERRTLAVPQGIRTAVIAGRGHHRNACRSEAPTATLRARSDRNAASNRLPAGAGTSSDMVCRYNPFGIGRL